MRRALTLQEEVDAAQVTTVLAQAYGGASPTEADLEVMGQDPFLVAYALVDRLRRTVVTCEVSRPTRVGPKRKVPDACGDVGVQAIGPFDFFRRLDFAVDWRERLPDGEA